MSSSPQQPDAAQNDEIAELRADIDRLARERAKDLQRISELENTVEDLQAKIEVLEDRAPDPSKKKYDEMDKSDKATVVREKLKKRAKATTGRAAMSYKDVLTIFDGHPSAGHAYDIMRSVGEAEGYDYDTDPEGQKRITVNLQKISL